MLLAKVLESVCGEYTNCNACSLTTGCVWNSNECILGSENQPWWAKASLCREVSYCCPQDTYYAINHIPGNILDFSFSGKNKVLSQGLFCKWSITNPSKSFVRIVITRQSVTQQVTLGKGSPSSFYR